MHHYIVNIGSNLGDRRLNLSRAVSRIVSRFGNFEASHVIESEAWGFDSENKFLNVCLMFASDEEPEKVFGELQEIERSISPLSHRDASGGYADRVIDIDLVACDGIVCDTPALTLPHPRLAERSFFLEPLQEIAPGWRHPVTGKNASEMLAELPARERKEESGERES